MGTVSISFVQVSNWIMWIRMYDFKKLDEQHIPKYGYLDSP